MQWPWCTISGGVTRLVFHLPRSFIRWIPYVLISLLYKNMTRKLDSFQDCYTPALTFVKLYDMDVYACVVVQRSKAETWIGFSFTLPYLNFTYRNSQYKHVKNYILSCLFIFLFQVCITDLLVLTIIFSLDSKNLSCQISILTVQ